MVIVNIEGKLFIVLEFVLIWKVGVVGVCFLGVFFIVFCTWLTSSF